jgi:ricin-type beta-trefoil lectin protein/Big-like domain-containing protein
LPRSQLLVPAFRPLIARALRASLLGASLLSLACSSQEDAPLNPNNFSLGEIAARELAPDNVAPGLVPNTKQRIRLAADTTRCLAVTNDQSIVGNPVLVVNCGSSTKQLFRFTSANEIRTEANSCIGAYSPTMDAAKVGSAVAVVACNGKAASKWTYDLIQRLANSAGGCYTVQGITLTSLAKAKTANCVLPAPWSQKVQWITPGGSLPTPTPTPPPPSPTIASITVSPATNSIVKGDSVRLTPTAYNSSGQPVAAVFTWSVTDGVTRVSVSQTGWVKALDAGSATVAASSAGITGTASITITLPGTTPPPTTQPPPAPAPPGVVPSIPPTLPLATVNTSWRAPTGRTLTVNAGGNLQAALDTARRGDEIVIAAGATFTGNFQAKPKAGTGIVLVRTSALSQLPPLGTRVSSTHGAVMPKIVTPNNVAAISVMPGASGWRFVGLEVTSNNTMTVVQYRLIWVGAGDRSQTTAALAPYDVVLDRLYVHGQPNVNSAGCIALNSAATAVVDSWISDCHGRGLDAQAIGGWNGPGPYLIQNNRLEGSGETIIFGGADPAIPNLVTSDVTVRRNYFTRPLNWKGVWTVKNHFELKNAQRVLVEGNVMENNWVDGQVGFAVLLGSVNQSGQCTWCVVQDVMLRYNHIHNSAGAFNILEHCGRIPGGPYVCGLGAPAQSSRRIALHNNLLTNIGASGLGTNGRMFQFVDGLDDIWIEYNTGFAPTTYMTFSQFTTVGKRFAYLNNVGGGALYNLHSPEGMGTAALAQHLSSPYVFSGNVIVGTSTGMPAYNSYVSSQTALGIMNPVPIGGTWSLSPLSSYFRVGMGGVTPGVNWAVFSSLTANVRL